VREGGEVRIAVGKEYFTGELNQHKETADDKAEDHWVANDAWHGIKF
jgi:hypothetical protein